MGTAAMKGHRTPCGGVFGSACVRAGGCELDRESHRVRVNTGVEGIALVRTPNATMCNAPRRI